MCRQPFPAEWEIQLGTNWSYWFESDFATIHNCKCIVESRYGLFGVIGSTLGWQHYPFPIMQEKHCLAPFGVIDLGLIWQPSHIANGHEKCSLWKVGVNDQSLYWQTSLLDNGSEKHCLCPFGITELNLGWWPSPFPMGMRNIVWDHL